MTSRHRVWGGFAVFCWLVSLYLAMVPPKFQDSMFGATAVRCDRLFVDALSPSDTACAQLARGRLHFLVTWTLLTAPVTLGYLVRVASRPRRDGEPILGE